MKTIRAWVVVVACLSGCTSAPAPTPAPAPPPKAPQADFVVTDKPIGHPIVGFGACMNPYLYAFPNTPDEINPQQLADLEAKVKELHPQFVRIFFLNSWWEKDTDPSIAKNHPGMRQSVIRTIRLAQDAGASVLLQLWYDPDHYKDPDGVARRFAKAIAELRAQHGLTAIRYATIQNEPDENKDDVTIERYPIVYRAFDRALRDLNIRDDIKIVGGDLVGERHDHWLVMLGNQLSPVLDGYSIHSYWDYWRIRTFRDHIRRTADVVSSMPARQRRPVYVTEFGTQGFRENPQIEPGKSDTGQPVADVPVYSFEIGIYLLDAINAGFVGTAQWDLYDVWYDRKMGYGLIGSVQNGFPKPGYALLSLFTHHCEPGWHGMKIDGAVEDVWVAALQGKTRDQLSVFVLNRVKREKQVTLAGFAPGRTFKTWWWNRDGKGALAPGDPVTADGAGAVTLKVPEMAIQLLSSE